MEPLYIFLIAVPVGALITWRLLSGSVRHHRDERRASGSMTGNAGRSHTRSVTPNVQYDAKTLRLCNSPCKAAIRVRHASWLANEAPQLPLADCDRKSACYCEFKKHGDRRVRVDRRYPAEDIVAVGPMIAPDSAVTTEDRREKQDRRSKRSRKQPVKLG